MLLQEFYIKELVVRFTPVGRVQGNDDEEAHLGMLEEDDQNTLKRLTTAILNLVKRKTPLESIMLTNLHFIEQPIIEILNALKEKKTMRRLSLGLLRHNFKMKKSVLKAYCDLVRENSNIEEVTSNCLDFTSDKGVRDLVQNLNRSVQQLSVHKDPVSQQVSDVLCPQIDKGIIHLKAFRFVQYPEQDFSGLKRILNSFSRAEEIQRLLVGGVMHRIDSPTLKSMGHLVSKTNSLRLLHFVEHADWIEKRSGDEIVEALEKNQTLSILKFQFALNQNVQAASILKKLKEVLMYHPTLEKLSLDNVHMDSEGYKLLAKILEVNIQLKVIYFRGVQHAPPTEDDVKALIELRSSLMRNYSLQHLKIETTPDDKYFKSHKHSVLYHQSVALCAKNAYTIRNLTYVETKKRKRPSNDNPCPGCKKIRSSS